MKLLDIYQRLNRARVGLQSPMDDSRFFLLVGRQAFRDFLNSQEAFNSSMVNLSLPRQQWTIFGMTITESDAIEDFEIVHAVGGR